jgi:hypothetical protein
VPGFSHSCIGVGINLVTVEMTLIVLILVVAALYAAVWRADARGYLAVMGLIGLAPRVMTPSALKARPSKEPCGNATWNW